MSRRKALADDPLEVVNRFIAAANRHDADGVAACVHREFESLQPIHPVRNFRGSAQLLANWKAIFRNEPGFRLTMLRSAVDDDTVWVELHGAGQEAEVAGIFIIGVENGLIRWARVYSELVEPAPEPVVEVVAVAAEDGAVSADGADLEEDGVPGERRLRLVGDAEDADAEEDEAAAETEPGEPEPGEPETAETVLVENEVVEGAAAEETEAVEDEVVETEADHDEVAETEAVEDRADQDEAAVAETAETVEAETGAAETGADETEAAETEAAETEAAEEDASVPPAVEDEAVVVGGEVVELEPEATEAPPEGEVTAGDGEAGPGGSEGATELDWDAQPAADAHRPTKAQPRGRRRKGRRRR